MTTERERTADMVCIRPDRARYSGEGSTFWLLREASKQLRVAWWALWLIMWALRMRFYRRRFIRPEQMAKLRKVIGELPQH